MKWKLVHNGTAVVDEKNNPVCSFEEGTDSFYKALIKYAPQMFSALMNYRESNKTGTAVKPKQVYNEIKKVIELIDDSTD